VGEVAASPTSLGFGLWQGKRWHATRTITLTNVSTRRLHLTVDPYADSEPDAVRFRVSPAELTLRVGQSRRVQITVTAPHAAVERAITGAIQVRSPGSETLRVPWALLFTQEKANILAHVSMSKRSFPASDTNPAILTVQAGTLVRDGGLQIEPVRRLDILLYTASGRYVGVMARLRDLLPGAYSFGITGRGPTSAVLAPGDYELRFAAWPTLPLTAKPTRAQVRFHIQ
jgi:hypothetical protein